MGLDENIHTHTYTHNHLIEGGFETQLFSY